MLLFMINMTATPEKCRELTLALESLVTSIRHIQGCLRCEFYSSVEDPCRFCFCSEWESGEHLYRYLQSETFSILLGAMSLLEHAYEARLYSGGFNVQIPQMLPELADAVQGLKERR